MHLSSREREIVEFACQGLCDKQSAARLGISSKTVTTYWERIRAKTKMPNRTAVVAMILGEEIALLKLEIHQLKRGKPSMSGNTRPS